MKDLEIGGGAEMASVGVKEEGRSERQGVVEGTERKR